MLLVNQTLKTTKVILQYPTRHIPQPRTIQSLLLNLISRGISSSLFYHMFIRSPINRDLEVSHPIAYSRNRATDPQAHCPEGVSTIGDSLTKALADNWSRSSGGWYTWNIPAYIYPAGISCDSSHYEKRTTQRMQTRRRAYCALAGGIWLHHSFLHRQCPFTLSVHHLALQALRSRVEGSAWMKLMLTTKAVIRIVSKCIVELYLIRYQRHVSCEFYIGG